VFLLQAETPSARATRPTPAILQVLRTVFSFPA
jgi:hypothetical protein